MPRPILNFYDFSTDCEPIDCTDSTVAMLRYINNILFLFSSNSHVIVVISFYNFFTDQHATPTSLISTWK